MNKLKSMFGKLNPENPVYIALIQTVLCVLAVIAGFITLIKDAGLFILIIMFGILCFIIYKTFQQFLDRAKKQKRRK